MIQIGNNSKKNARWISHKSGVISLKNALVKATDLSEALPDLPAFICLCNQIDTFLYTFFASLYNGQTCILVEDHSEKTIRSILKHHPDAYILIDEDRDDLSDLPIVQYDSLDIKEHNTPIPLTPPEIDEDYPLIITYSYDQEDNLVPFRKGWHQLESDSIRVYESIIRDGEQHPLLWTWQTPRSFLEFELIVVLPILIGLDAVVDSVFSHSMEPYDHEHFTHWFISQSHENPYSLIDSIQARAFNGIIRSYSNKNDISESVVEEPVLYEIYENTNGIPVAWYRPNIDASWNLLAGYEFKQDKDVIAVQDSVRSEFIPLTDNIDIIDARHFRIQLSE